METSKLIKDFIGADLEHTCTISVVGDVMLDEYYDVTMERISPEFPIPIMRSKQDSCKKFPGGAANVALQFANFNSMVYLTGMTRQVMPMLPMNIKDHSPHDYGNSIPIKKRFYQGDFPLARWDVEEPFYGLGKELMASRFEGFELKESEVTIFSDYNKGVFNSGWYKRSLNDRNTIVDPKGDLSRWQGCTILKPNSVEAKALTGEDKWERQAERLKKMTGCRDVVITQGEKGVVGITPSGFFEYRPNPSGHEVNSVIGAGDCFVAFLAMAMARGFSTYEASIIAFEAGAVYVQSKHNRPLKPAELLTGRCGSQVVFTNGCFDILHAGHIQTLEFAKSQGDILVVGVNSDASVKRLKGDKRPINTLADRMRVLSAMKCVDCVMPFEEDTPLNLIKYVRPDKIVKGGDYKQEDVVGHDLAEVVIAPVVSGLSTTGFIERLKTGNFII